jgi:hypothetical protein
MSEVVSPPATALHDLRLKETPWIGARELAQHFHHSTETRFRRLYRLRLAALARDYPTLIHRDPDHGWQMDPLLAATLFGLPLPASAEPTIPDERCATQLLDFTGDPALVYRARRIRESYWIAVVRELAHDAASGASPEQIERHRRRALILFNQRRDPQWWLARDPALS